MRFAKQKELLRAIQLGDVFECGDLIKGVAPNEPLVWQAHTIVEDGGGRTITFKVYYMDVLTFELKGKINKNDSIIWSGECILQK